jgi:hypothetical protein
MRLIPVFLALAVSAGAMSLGAATCMAQSATPSTTSDGGKATAPDAAAGDSKAAPAAGAAATPPDPNATDVVGGDDVSIGEIPDVQTEELTPDLAKKAIDGYQLVHDKYQDSPMEDYADLQEFVDKDPKGKDFEADIKGIGFTTVNEWNIAITSVSVAYNNILDDQTEDIKQQIEDLKKSTDMADDMRQKNIKSLEASIPSENNTKIVQDLMKDTGYAEKLKLLETTEE